MQEKNHYEFRGKFCCFVEWDLKFVTMSSQRALKQYILAKRALEPGITVGDIVKDIRKIKKYRNAKYNSLFKLVARTIRNYDRKGSRKPRVRSKRTENTIQLVKKIAKKAQGKRSGSIRAIKSDLVNNHGINISKESVRRILIHDLDMKFVRFRKCQRLTQQHKDERVKSAIYLRQKYGVRPESKRYKWDKVVITDFSAPIRCRRKLNGQNDGIWINNDTDMKTEEVKVLVNKGFEKYSKGMMLFGGICGEGLIPRDGPIDFSSWLRKKCAEIGKEKNTLDNKLYATFITETFAPIMERELDEDLDEYIWEDDCDKKHRTKHVLEQLGKVFKQRIDPTRQCPKLADVYPIENVWGILYEKARGREFKNILALKRFINKCWREIDTEICTKMMQSIPYRLGAIIKCKGEQINSYDYK